MSWWQIFITPWWNRTVMFFTLQLKKSVTNIIDVIDCASAEGLFRLENWDFGSGKKSRCEKEKFPKRAVYLGDKKVHTLPAEKNLKKILEMKILAAKKCQGMLGVLYISIHNNQSPKPRQSSKRWKNVSFLIWFPCISNSPVHRKRTLIDLISLVTPSMLIFKLRTSTECLIQNILAIEIYSVDTLSFFPWICRMQSFLTISAYSQNQARKEIIFFFSIYLTEEEITCSESLCEDAKSWQSVFADLS